MSTPATYSFLGQAPAPAATTLYIHLDGNPQGAATYLRVMLSTNEGLSAVAFIRANTGASLVCGHDVWSNTAYRYTLRNRHLLAEQRLVAHEEGWKTIFDGDVVDFINNEPGEMLHAVALYEHGPVGYYTQYRLGALVGEALKMEMEAVQRSAGPAALLLARQRVRELQAVHRRVFRLEEFGEAVGA